MDAGDYYTAGVKFNNADGYADSSKFLLKCLANEPALLSLRPLSVQLGHYSDYITSQRPIEWWVLDSGNGKILLICKNALASNTKYQEGSSWSTCSWENCDIRYWLNGDFYNNCFSEEERNMILTSSIWSDDKSVVTKDKIFILSRNGLDNYLDAEYYRKVSYIGTSYSSYNSQSYWVRNYTDENCVVYRYNNIISGYTSKDPWQTAAVRPVMWISVN